MRRSGSSVLVTGSAALTAPAPINVNDTAANAVARVLFISLSFSNRDGNTRLAGTGNRRGPQRNPRTVPFSRRMSKRVGSASDKLTVQPHWDISKAPCRVACAISRSCQGWLHEKHIRPKRVLTGAWATAKKRKTR
ncbi:hypothetical protein RHECNPAF_2330026 [Rhizobium etli CNPAF512]|nr:hypothetical protein RHECNPAF_2330026 [Rhizobium etli CNPAF512]